MVVFVVAPPSNGELLHTHAAALGDSSGDTIFSTRIDRLLLFTRYQIWVGPKCCMSVLSITTNSATKQYYNGTFGEQNVFFVLHGTSEEAIISLQAG